ncbi:neuronal acetylcholine receptor subunit beta-2-like [Mizuhopecten yessoensis]|uniref:Neuronal acetylcholine receptor subunit alpha-6 n=1 Tax=Mizuhopecten yessoensis TaxID=6573 RepID=A0A210PMY4_MIZYE|nr:neuronal acetylcholine receptor subunit beta-2-like [Mizuhopecten yessoensis]OWF37865.1 Neuronal acetylcholine receptor subunit alpha-6 [Mizuhopecten yessoensis]
MLKEFNIVESVLGTHLLFMLQWTDEYIRWDSEEYDNITVVNLPLLDVWVPPMVLVNPADSYGFLSKEKDMLLVQYSSEGLAMLLFATYLESTCKPFIKYFPFDSHTCHLMISHLGYSLGEVISVPSHVYLDQLVDNGQWTVDALNLTAKFIVAGNNASRYVDLSIQLSRRPEFLLLNLFIPIAFLICMNLFVFFLPAECGEKASYSITVLLSLAIFMTIVMDQLPPLSTDVPVVSIILCIHLANNVIVCTCTILSLNYHHRSDTRDIPCHLRCLTMLVTWRTYKSNCNTKDVLTGKTPESMSPRAKTNLGVTGTDGITHHAVVSEDIDRRPILTWQIVSHAIDRWNFSICIMITIMEMGLVFYHSVKGM